MNEYYVEEIVEENVAYRQVKWGVFQKEHSDTEMLNKPKDNPNLIVWTYYKLAAEKIAELLNLDDFMHEEEDN